MSKQPQNPLHDFVMPSDELTARRVLSQALQDLPLVELAQTEQASGWENIVARLSDDSDSRAGSGSRRYGWLRAEEWMGVAAAVLVLITVVFLPSSNQPGDQFSEPVAAERYSQLQEWVSRSQLLESQLRSLRTQTPTRVMSGQQALAMDELERMIGFVDLQITASQTASGYTADNDLLVNERTGLWQQRVVLLNELLASQYGQSDYFYRDGEGLAGTIDQQI